jgi:lipoprotein-anchoring transpeptidase ErfK/SrfK
VTSLSRRGILCAFAAIAGQPLLSNVGFANAKATDEAFKIDVRELERLPRKYRRRRVSYASGEKPGTIIVDPHSRFLYLVEDENSAMRYGIGVGRQGFEWSGDAVIRRKAKWPRWTPPAEMVERDPYAAKWAAGMPGGPSNPLGARALYLFQGNVDTLYRIHGTYQPETIGKAVSSGCIRMVNADVADLYERVRTGARVKVLTQPLRLRSSSFKDGRKRKSLFEIFR